MKRLTLIVVVGLLTQTLAAREWHVSVKGNDKNDGSASKHLKTISAAARLAQAGDAIIVHSGTYRERVTPPRGGESDSKRIVYQAAKGDKVVIKGSEVVTGWEHVKDGVWKATIPNASFGDYNPYTDLIVGDWFKDNHRPHHTGEVYLNGRSLFEKASLDDVMNPKPHPEAVDKEASLYTWYCRSDDNDTHIWANFHDHNPNKELVEINVRDACFYPDAPGRNYITVRGFHMSQAATQWAAPTAEQIGLIGTHWSKGWIIENNVISDSKCTGVTLGKDRKTGHNVCIKDPSKGGDVHYNEVIVRALQDGWDKDKIGSHIVRNNTISNCEQAGICGSLGPVFSEVSGNHIFNIWTKRQFQGFEIAGIKFHGAIDTVIRNNRIHDAGRGMWMDWMAQGTRITGNLCYNNSTDDFFSEVNHGPYLIDNNLFLSEVALLNMSHGGAYAHNLAAGMTRARTTSRGTPYMKEHSTEVGGLRDLMKVGDIRFYNNLFVGDGAVSANAGDQRTGYGLAVFNHAELLMYVDGNVYLNGAAPYAGESNRIEQAGFDPKIEVVEEGNDVYLHITVDPSWGAMQNKIVTTKLLGKAKVPDLPYMNRDGTPLKVDTDYFGKKRNYKNPTAGPFENPGEGRLSLKVWPVGQM
ncbi:MAG TPA: right-handed parallel beta-helix repeat-containing protein [Sedimentisphaerales bacterium]|nr:right-handed parallel beta-helix repeat-containing protein [Sedimentisphaerales bacterium]